MKKSDMYSVILFLLNAMDSFPELTAVQLFTAIDNTISAFMQDREDLLQ